MKQASLIVVGFLMLLSCQTGSISKKLTEVDSLVFKEEYDSAYQKISSIDETTIKNQEDQAHYNLLKVQTGYLANKPAASPDSLLDEVIDYYQKHNNSKKLADAYYYKAIGYCNNKEYKKAIQLFKEAELLADKTGNKYQQYKIAEGIAFVNRMDKAYDLQLKYAKKAYSLAKALDKKNWIAYSCYTIEFAYNKLGFEDSAYFYLQQIPLYIKYANKNEKPTLLATLGYYLMDNHPEEAKKYYLESLKYQELTASYQNLATISYEEGKPEEAYSYLKKALHVKDATPKDYIIRNLIELDLERGKTDSISDMVTQIFEIRDSIEAKLRNDTIKDLQTRFDHETAMREKDQTIIKWQWGILILAVALLISVGLYLRRRYLAKIQLQAYQMQIHEYLNQIAELKASGTDAQQEIEELNKNIRDIMDNRSPSLSKGRMLYDDVVENKGKDKWKKDDIEAFLEYYTATNYKTVERIRKTPREEPLTDYRLLFLILVEMGKSDYEIMQILSITKETLRTHRYRTRAQE